MSRADQAACRSRQPMSPSRLTGRGLTGTARPASGEPTGQLLRLAARDGLAERAECGVVELAGLLVGVHLGAALHIVHELA